MADEDYNVAESGASVTYPQQCSALRKNGFVVIKNKPCKIVEMSTSKTGKHGHAKVHLVAIDIFNGKKYEDICPSTHNMNVPIVTRKDYTVVNISGDGFFTLLDDKGETFSIKMSEGGPGPLKTVEAAIEFFEEISAKDQGVLANVVTALGEEMVKELKISKD